MVDWAKVAVRGAAAQIARWGRAPLRQPAPLQTLSSAALERSRRFFGRRKFFVIGYPRSGTTLLARLLRLHPDICCLWQAHFFSGEESLAVTLATQDLRDWLSRPDNRWVEGEVSATEVLRLNCDYVMEAQAQAQGKSIVGDKSPYDRWRESLPRLAKVYPDAQVIQIVRDGRDVAVSRRLQAFIDHPELLDQGGHRIRAQLAKMGEEYFREGHSLFDPNWLAREAWSWSEEAVEVDRMGEELFAEAYHVLRFEDLLSDTQDQMGRLWQALGADRDISEQLTDEVRSELERNPAAAWHQQAAPELAQAFERGAAGGWRAVFNDSDREIFRRQAQRGLERWGYLGED